MFNDKYKAKNIYNVDTPEILRLPSERKIGISSGETTCYCYFTV